jgi:transcriptional regulator with XRE-family HTH domain
LLERLSRTERGDSARWRGLLNEVKALSAKLQGDTRSRDLSEFPAILREHREAAGLTQKELAELSGLSVELIRGMEAGRKRATAASVRQLQKVGALRLDSGHLLPRKAHGCAEALNCWIAPNFDAVDMLRDLKRSVLSGGGRIEQTFAYLDPQSALDWWDISNDPKYVMSYRSPMPLESVAKQVIELIGRAPLDLIALGSGDGVQETRLAQALIGLQQEENLRVYLIDISQPLLSKAHRYAKDRLDAVRGATVIGVQGNFHLLPLYEQLFYTSSKRYRMFTLLGPTLHSLDNELLFFRDSLRAAAPKDLALVDFTLAVGSPDRVEEIYRKDSVLQAPPSETMANWLGGPFRRYGGATKAELSYRLELTNPVPGSYSLDHILRVDGSREFLFWRARRYDAALLSEALRKIGWEQLLYLPFGAPMQRNQQALMLLQKR